MTNGRGFFTARYFVPFLRIGNPAAASAPGKFAVISSQMGSSTRSGTSAPIIARQRRRPPILRGHWRWNWPRRHRRRRLAPGMGSDRYGWNRAAITPQAGEGLLARFDALTMDSSGIFETWDGEVMPFNDPLLLASVRDHPSRLFPGAFCGRMISVLGGCDHGRE